MAITEELLKVEFKLALEVEVPEAQAHQLPLTESVVQGALERHSQHPVFWPTTQPVAAVPIEMALALWVDPLLADKGVGPVTLPHLAR